MSFQDHFSERAKNYSRFRPGYPEALFRFLASRVSRHVLAWDCATGNGQSAVALSLLFQRVIATDASRKQIIHAHQVDRVFYCVSLAENAPLQPESIDLITVSQALHWLNPEPFFREVKRVLRTDGLFAAWFYQLANINPDVDEILKRYYTDIVGPYWPPERKLLEDGYRSREFPFQEEESPEFEMKWEWDLHELIGYLNTWSAAQEYKRHHGSDPFTRIERELMDAWGDPSSRRLVRWPLTIRLGRP